MPTPFTHLNITQRLLNDTAIPPAYRELIAAHLPAFQLGSIVADARVSGGIGRETTHFYSYSRPIVEHPWRVMLDKHPTLKHPHDKAHLVFLAGYVAHLATDESWALKMVRPEFGDREWDGVERQEKFFALHLILTHMDERDELKLESWQADSLMTCLPDDWLPFMSDEVLCAWRDLVANQITPDGDSQTLSIFSSRLGIDMDFIRETLDNPEKMQHLLWQHVPQSLLEITEIQMYAFTRDQLCVYLTQYA